METASVVMLLLVAIGFVPIAIVEVFRARKAARKETAAIAAAARGEPQTNTSFFGISRGTTLAWCRDGVIRLTLGDAMLYCRVGNDLYGVLREELPYGGRVNRQELEYKLHQLQHDREMAEAAKQRNLDNLLRPIEEAALEALENASRELRRRKKIAGAQRVGA